MNRLDQLIGSHEKNESSNRHLIWVTGLAFLLGIVFDARWVPPRWTLSYWWLWLGAALVGLISGILFYQKRRGIIAALAATIAVILATSSASPLIRVVENLSLSESVTYWLVGGPGGGTIGLLLPALIILAAGRWLFGVSLSEQWGGILAFKRPSWKYGLPVAILFAALTVGLALLTSTGRFSPSFNWTDTIINMFSNLWEEILTRGILLYVIRKNIGPKTAMVWTSIVFGLFHGVLNPKSYFIIVTCWAWAWAVLKSRSLWGGWVVHQVSDMLIDNLMIF